MPVSVKDQRTLKTKQSSHLSGETYWDSEESGARNKKKPAVYSLHYQSASETVCQVLVIRNAIEFITDTGGGGGNI